MLKSKRFYMFAFIGTVVLVFFTTSLTITRKTSPDITMPEYIHIDLSGIQQLHADENAWGIVRGSVTWANANSTAIDSLLNSFNDAGVFELPAGTYTRVDGRSGNVATKWRLDRGNFNASVTASVGSVGDFANRFTLWRADNDEKAFEFYFNDFGDTSAGALIVYRPQVLNPQQFNGNSESIVESYITGAPGSRSQTYSWTNGPLAADGSTDQARVFLEEMDAGELLCVKAVVRLNEATSNQVRAQFDALPGDNPCGSGNLYYATGYGQKTAEPFETTAKVALWDGQTGGDENFGDAHRICTLNIESTQFRLDYGLFNGGGFIDDGVAAGDIPAGFRSAADIDILFAEISDDTVDDLQKLTKVTIDGLDSDEIKFHDTDPVPTENSF